MKGARSLGRYQAAMLVFAVATSACQDVRSRIGANQVSAILAAGEETAQVVPVPISVQILPQTLILPKGITATLAAIGRYPYESKDITAHVTWSSRDPEVVLFEDPKNPHLLIAKNPGRTVVTTTIGEVSTTIEVQVVEASVRRLVVDGADSPVDLIRGADGLPIPSNIRLRATAIYSDQTPVDVTSATEWIVSKPDLVTVSETEIGSLEFRAPGEIEIKGRYIDIGGNAFEATTTGYAMLRDSKVVSLNIEATPLLIPLGGEKVLGITAVLENGVELKNVEATCRVADDLIARIEAQRLIALTMGSTLVTCAFNDVIAEVPVIIKDPEIVAISVLPTDLNQPLGVTAVFQALASYTDGTQIDVTSAANWLVANEGIASISNMTGSRGQISSSRIGTTSVTALFRGLSGSTNFVVTEAQLTKITITPEAPIFPKGKIQAFQATGLFTDGTISDITNDCKWASGHVGTLSVSNSTGSKGLASGAGAGTTTLRASLSGISQTITVTVAPAVIESFQVVTTTTTSRAKGLWSQYRALATLTDSSTLDYTEAANWSFDIISPGYNYAASVSNTAGTKGRVTALNEGKSKIIAAYEGHTAALDFVVTEKQPTHLSVTKNASLYFVGDSFQATAKLFYTDLTSRDVTDVSGDVDLSIAWSTTSNITYTTTATVSASGLVQALWPAGISLNATVTSVKFGPFGVSSGFEIYTPCETGNRHSYHCVYLGSLNQSCADVCGAVAANYHPATSYYYGSQSGNSDNCSEALRIWEGESVSVEATGTFGDGLGCGILLPGDGDSLYGRYTGPATTSEARYSLYRRVCACDR